MRAMKILVAAALVAAALPARGAIPWFKDDVDAALKEAKLRKRPLLVYFHTTWCSWCIELEDKVFSDGAVEEEAASFVPLRLNCDRREGQRLMKRYNVSSFPTILVLSQGGDVLGRLGMYRPAPDFVRFLTESRTPGETLAAVDKRIANGDRTPALLLHSGSRHFEAGEPDTAAARYQEAITVALAAGQAEAAVDGRLGLAGVRSATGDPDAALEQYRTVLKDSPGSKRLAEAFVGAIVLLREQDRGSEIDALFRDFAGRFPDDPAVLNDWARRILDARGDPGLAVAKAAKAVAISPATPDYQETLARALLAAKKPVEALDAVQRAIELRPADKELRLLRLEIMDAVRDAAAPAAAPKS
jgi:thioredoxin-like negative regulator of GroEL